MANARNAQQQTVVQTVVFLPWNLAWRNPPHYQTSNLIQQTPPFRTSFLVTWWSLDTVGVLKAEAQGGSGGQLTIGGFT